VGVQNYIRISQQIPSPEAALFYLRRIQLAEKFHRTVRPLTKMILVGPTPVYLDQKGNMVVAISVDYLYWDEDLANRINNVRQKLGKATCDMCITGSASDLAKKNLAAAGINLYERWGLN